MLGRVVVENGVKKIVPLTADCGSGNPCGAIITVYQNTVPNGYLPLGAQYDIAQFPVLYSILGTDTIPTASALGLPTLTTGQYVIKATSGINENQADNVLSALSPVDVVALNNVHSVTSNAVASAISDMTIHKIWGMLSDFSTKDVVLESGITYLYINTHVNNIEMVLFSLFNSSVRTLCRLTNYNITDFLALNADTVRLTSNGACRGFIFRIANTYGT